MTLKSKILPFIKNFFSTTLSDGYKEEFAISINRINIARAKITALVIVVLETLMILIHCIINRGNLLSKPYVYYGSMYVVMLTAMIGFFALFSKLGTDVPKYQPWIRAAGLIFIGFILLWCAGISLLDQFSSGQVIVYVVGVIAIAITPFFRPLTLFLVYITVHAMFLLAMPHFQDSTQLLIGNAINSTTFVIMSWAIACMRYKKQAEEFINRKIILETTVELRRVNLQLLEANVQLEKLSMMDGLTGVTNRITFEKQLKDEWNRCKRHSIPLSCIMVDVDYFKEYNDTFGHQAGDRYIKLIAEILSEQVKRSSDKVARYGGDEFAILLPHTEKESALHLAEQMRKAVEEKCVPNSHSAVAVHLTISLGVNTVIPSEEMSADEFISSTDKALYLAKKRRNCTVFAPQKVYEA